MLSASAIWFSIYVYRHTNPPIPKRLKAILTIIRGLVLLIILFIIFEPVLNISWKRSEIPSVAVLLDNSASMTLIDEEISRAKKAKTVLNFPFFQQQQKKLDFAFYEFSDRLNPIDFRDLDSLNFAADGTDLTAALKQVREKNQHRYLAGIVLLSDGINNLGENPLHFLDDLNLPVFPISVGRAIDNKDVIISKISTNRITYTNNEVPLEITIRAQGYANHKIKVNLFKGSKLLDSEFAHIGDLPETKIRMKFIPSEPGLQKFSIQTPVLKDELTANNNNKNFYVNVLKSRMKILYVTGGPGADFSFIKRTLEENQNIETEFWIAKKNGGFYQGDFSSILNRDKKYDCIILHNFPPKNYPAQPISILNELAEKSQVPILFIGGNYINYSSLLKLENFLPFKGQLRESNEITTLPVLTIKGQTHPVTRIDDDAITNQTLWTELPPVFYSFNNVTLTPGSETLAEIKFKPGRKKTSNRPFIAVRKTGARKSLAIFGYGIWRWDLLMWGVGKSNLVFSQLINNSIRWLTNKEDSKTVRIYPTTEIFRSGQPVSFSAEVYNENYDPLDNAEVKLKIQNDSTAYEIFLPSIGDGKYEGSVSGIPGGDYNYEGSAIYKNIKMGADNGQFSVEDFKLEYQNTRIDENFLKQLALRSGGQYIDDSNFASLDTLLSFPVRESVESREWELWSKLLLLIAVILLLSLEWFSRKRRGLL